MGSEDFSLEEAALDDLHEDYSIIERPVSERIFAIFGIIVVLVGIFFFLRSTYFGSVKNNQFQNRSYANAGREIILRAPRGIIYDRYGISLVENKPSFNVSLNLSELFKNKERINDTLLSINKHINFDIEEVSKSLENVNLEKQSYFILARNVPLNDLIDLKKENIPSVLIEDGFTRSYLDGEVFSHIIGYTGMVNSDDLEEDSNLDLNDEIGKSGIERMYDEYLRGENGSRILLRDAQNNSLGERIDKTVRGGDKVYTTIDAELQKFFYKTLKNQLSSLGRKAGAGLVMQPSTGEVLALVSLPSFDPSNLTSGLFTDPLNPTFNRVVSGVYSPGSTIKPLVAFGALEEGIVDPMTSVYSSGSIELPNPYDPSNPSKFVDWKAHGWVNLYSAIARSCNVYFYEVGGGFEKQKGLGIDKLHDYWERFFLDKKTGIDMPGESVGYLPDPELKEKRTGQIWRIGDTYNVSIGQGDLMVSPLELLRYIGGIATKGKLFQPFIVSKIEKDKENVVYEKEKSYETVDYKNISSFDEVETGMLHAVSQDYGTANMLKSIPMEIAGKTGSAQIQNNQKTNAFFVGYSIPQEGDGSVNKLSSAPEDIAVLVLIEDAKEGSLNAVPVAQKVFQWYYDNRISK